MIFQVKPETEFLYEDERVTKRYQDDLKAIDDDIPWQEATLGELAAKMFYKYHPLMPPRWVDKKLEGTQLGKLIIQFHAGASIYTSLDEYKEWRSAFYEVYFPNLKRVIREVIPEEVDGYLSHCFYLEIFCQDSILPPQCWVDVEKPNNRHEVIEVLNNVPQYKREGRNKNTPLE